MNQNAWVTAASQASGARRVEGEGERSGGVGAGRRGKKPGLQQQRLYPGCAPTRESEIKGVANRRGEGAGQPVESSPRGGGSGFHRDFGGLLGSLIIFKFLNPA